jgi:hypothetical protein
MRALATAIAACLFASALAAQAGWRDEQAYGTWSDRSEFNAQVFNGRVWVFEGGVPWRSTGDGSVWSSIDCISWQEEVSRENRATPPWPPNRGFGAYTVFDSRMWKTGGLGIGQGSSDVWSTADGLNWREETPSAPWLDRMMHAALAFDGRMWVMGGRQGNTGYLAMNDVWSSTDGVNWTQAATVYPDIWPQRFYHRAVVYNGRMWVMGGQNGSKFFNDVWSSADGVHWVEETSNAPWTPRWRHVVIEYAGRLWVIGGHNWEGDYYGDVWSTTDGRNWRYEGQPWFKRLGHEAVVLGGRIWVIGGGMFPIEGAPVQQGGVWSYGVHVHERTLPVARPDEPYAEVIEARGGYEPLTWTLIDGALPPGLQLRTHSHGRCRSAARRTRSACTRSPCASKKPTATASKNRSHSK